jgi:hypothetical protein
VLTFFETKKAKKHFMTMSVVYSACALYPEKHSLADTASNFKVEGRMELAKGGLQILYGEKLSASLSMVYDTPEYLIFMAPAQNDMVRWLCSLSGAFSLKYELKIHDAIRKELALTPDQDYLFLLMDDLQDIRFVAADTYQDTRMLFDRVATTKCKTMQVHKAGGGKGLLLSSRKPAWITPPPVIPLKVAPAIQAAPAVRGPVYTEIPSVARPVSTLTAQTAPVGPIQPRGSSLPKQRQSSLTSQPVLMAATQNNFSNRSSTLSSVSRNPSVKKDKSMILILWFL